MHYLWITIALAMPIAAFFTIIMVAGMRAYRLECADLELIRKPLVAQMNEGIEKQPIPSEMTVLVEKLNKIDY